MDADILATLERTLDRQNKLIASQARRLTVSNRLLLAALVIAARQSPDPVRYLDDLRTRAQDPLDEDLGDVKDDLERALAKLQAQALKPRG